MEAVHNPYKKLKSDHHQAVPRTLLRAMAGLALFSLGLATFAVVTDRPPAAQIQTAAAVKEVLIEIKARADGGTTVVAMDGTILSDTPHNEAGFITVVRNALEFNRRRLRLTENTPVHLIRFADGRVGLRDDASGWKMNVVGFGQDNARVWNEIIDRN